MNEKGSSLVFDEIKKRMWPHLFYKNLPASYVFQEYDHLIGLNFLFPVVKSKI